MTKLIDILSDPENHDNISLYDENGAVTEFSQVAMFPYMVGDENRVYAILEPILSDGEESGLIVFRVEKYDDDVSLSAEFDEAVAEGVFNKFLQLLEEYNG